MGDRTHTVVTVHTHTYKQLLINFNNNSEELMKHFGIDEIEHYSTEEVNLIEYEANYGEMEELEKLLWKSKIDYNKTWQDGCEYAAGELFCRNIKGSMQKFEITEDQNLLLNTLQQLKELPVAKMVEEMEKKIKELQPFKPEPLKSPNSLDFIMND